MKKLSRRELIILIVVVVAVLYGFYDLVLKKRLSPPELRTVPREEVLRQTDDLVFSIARDLRELEVSVADAYVIELAGTRWRRDPFFIGTVTTTGLADLYDISFLYTGYLEVGTKRMAIINGIDYHVGEAMDIPGFILHSVTPRQVVILDQEGRQITVPFVEE